MRKLPDSVEERDDLGRGRRGRKGSLPYFELAPTGVSYISCQR